jgi:hypothetical protein
VRGIFGIVLAAGAAASVYAGYRAASHGGGHNPSGIGDATLPEQTRRRATRRFKWLRHEPAAGSPEETRELEAQRITE